MSTASDIGAIMSGTGALVGGIGAATGTKKQIREAAKHQRELMDYQNALNQANVADQRAYLKQYEAERYQNYDSLQAQVRDAKAAGLNPEVVAGAASGGSGGASGAPGVSVPGAPDVANPWERVGRTISDVGNSIMQGIQFANDMAKAVDEKKARQYDLEARDLDNARNRVALDLEKEKLKDALFQGTRRAWNAYKQDSDYFLKQAAENRARDAHDLTMRERNAEFSRNATRFEWEAKRNEQETAYRELQYWLGKENLTEQQWRREFRNKYGQNPERSMSMGDFLYRLGVQSLDLPFGDSSLGETISNAWQDTFSPVTDKPRYGKDGSIKPLNRMQYFRRTGKWRF